MGGSPHQSPFLPLSRISLKEMELRGYSKLPRPSLREPYTALEEMSINTEYAGRQIDVGRLDLLYEFGSDAGGT